MGIASDLIYIMLAGLVGGIVARFFRQPLIIGYILSGIVIGPYTGGPTVSSIHQIEKLAEIGVALLLFALGLEFSLQELRRLARIVFLAAPTQMILTGLCGYGIGKLFGLSVTEAIWFGAIMAPSSTMVVLKSLDSSKSLDTPHGRSMMGLLIAQDLAVIPIMLILPQISAEEIVVRGILIAVVKSLAFLVTMYFIGTKILPRLFSLIASWESRELFLICTMAIALGLGLASYSLGLSFAFGAFIAGMMLSDTDFSHKALSDISSLRDIFGLVFFVSVGMLIDPQYCLDNIATVSVVLVSIVILKAIATGFSIYLIGARGLTPWIVGFGLSQIGEFSFLITQVGVQHQVISRETSSLIIAVVTVSMLLTTMLLSLGYKTYGFISSIFGIKDEVKGDAPSPTKKVDHVVIIGGGVVGQQVARMFTIFKIDHLVIEADYRAAMHIRDSGSEVIYGDASQSIILEAANLKDARLILLAVTESDLTIQILDEIRRLNRDVSIVAKVNDSVDRERFKRFNLTELIEPKLEASLEMMRQGLLSLGMGEGKVFHILAVVRDEFANMGSQTNIVLAKSLNKFISGKLLDMTMKEVTIQSNLVDRKLKDIGIREKFGVSVVGIIRGEEFISNPAPDIFFKVDDLVVVIGTTQSISRFNDFFEEN